MSTGRALLFMVGLALLASCVSPSDRTDPGTRATGYPGRGPYADALGEPRDMRVLALGGVRRYRSEGWGELDSQPVVGFTISQEPAHWLLGLEGAMSWSGGDGDVGPVADADVETWEGLAGVIKSLTLVGDRLVLELGAGYSLSYVEIADDDAGSLLSDDDAWWSSVYARAALILRLGDEAWVGVSARGARGGGSDLLGADVDGDYEQLAFVLGARW